MVQLLLEAVLYLTKRGYTDAEAGFLDMGAQHLIEHRLVCSKSNGSVINEKWLKPFFPRYFEYDILRGLSYLVEWSRRREQPLSFEIIEKGLDRLANYLTDSGIVIARRVNDKNGDWRGRAFPLMKADSEVGTTSALPHKTDRRSLRRSSKRPPPMTHHFTLGQSLFVKDSILTRMAPFLFGPSSSSLPLRSWP